LARIPLKSADRDNSYPLILGGGPALLNPEPMADFFDGVFLGDGEEAILEIIDCLLKLKDANRRDKLVALSVIPGMYIPSFYKPEYENGQFKSLKTIEPKAPDKIKIRSCGELKAEYYPDKPLVPFIETTHDRLSIEIMRGCARGCRFCQAGFQYRPKRYRNPSDIYGQIQKWVDATGYDEVTLLSLSSTDFPDLEPTVEMMLPYFRQNRLSLALPSLRPGTLSQRMLEHLKSQRRSGITFAPEAGTQRLRDIIGKNLTEQEILNGIKQVFDNDWQLIKLYFMIGLPGETDDDIKGITELIQNISNMARFSGGKRNINITISPFSPKPGTPWQWAEQPSPERINQIYNMLSRSIRARNIALKFRNPHLSLIEGIIGRGDRRMSEAILSAYQLGARLDGWSEHFSYERWQTALEQNGYDIGNLLTARDTDIPLPWEHIDKGLSKKFLLEERDRAQNGVLPPGANPQATESQAPNELAFGRAPKKRITAQTAPPRTNVRLKYARDQRLRYCSHLDIMRAFQRAFRRAGLPISYSEGFHPHMRTSFGPPLPLGYISEAEYLDLQLDSPLEKNHLVSLNESLPPGLQIVLSKIVFGRNESLVQLINSVTYSVALDPVNNGLPSLIDKLLAEKQITIIRRKHEEIKELSLGHLLYELNLNDDTLNMELGVNADGYIRPSEILIFGLGFSENDAISLLYKRTGQYLKQGVHKVDPIDIV
jgi:radical SAM family uncharacterized protein/radical SAM-linked protein